MAPVAHARSERTGRDMTTSKKTTEDAARYLSALVYRNGWRGDAVGRLMAGERLRHKGFEYWVD